MGWSCGGWTLVEVAAVTAGYDWEGGKLIGIEDADVIARERQSRFPEKCMSVAESLANVSGTILDSASRQDSCNSA